MNKHDKGSACPQKGTTGRRKGMDDWKEGGRGGRRDVGKKEGRARERDEGRG